MQQLINTLFQKRRNKKWTWKSFNGQTKNKTVFILCGNPGTVQDVDVIRKLRCSDHRLVRAKITLI